MKLAAVIAGAKKGSALGVKTTDIPGTTRETGFAELKVAHWSNPKFKLLQLVKSFMQAAISSQTFLILMREREKNLWLACTEFDAEC